MTTLASVSLTREHQEHRACMVGQLTVSLGLVLSQTHHDSDARCSPRSLDPTLTMLGDSHLFLQALNTQS